MVDNGVCVFGRYFVIYSIQHFTMRPGFRFRF